MDLARSLAKRSTCKRTSVGCVVVTLDNTRVLGVGYNGGAKGLSNGCLSEEPGKCGHLHAEINALLKTSYDPTVLKKIYTTSSPCYTCAVAIVNAGIAHVIYDEEYRLREGIELLLRARVRVWHGEKEQVQVDEDG